MTIAEPRKQDFEEMAELWEASVRASHFFLKEEDIPELKKAILNTYFHALSLRICKDENGNIQGLLGVDAGKVEMLFIRPESWGKGTGSLLLSYAIREMKAVKLDVNEDNPKARDFYLHMGFEITGRSPLDGQRRAYPLLHMEWKPKTTE